MFVPGRWRFRVEWSVCPGSANLEVTKCGKSGLDGDFAGVLIDSRNCWRFLHFGNRHWRFFAGQTVAIRFVAITLNGGNLANLRTVGRGASGATGGGTRYSFGAGFPAERRLRRIFSRGKHLS